MKLFCKSTTFTSTLALSLHVLKCATKFYFIKIFQESMELWGEKEQASEAMVECTRAQSLSLLKDC